MKQYLISFIVLVLLTGTSCQEKVSLEKEKAAIIAAIQDEKEGYINEDMDQLSRNVLQDSSYTFMYSDVNTFYLNHGFTKQADQVREGWKNRNPEVTDRTFDFDIIELKIFPQAAWTTIEVSWQFVNKGDTLTYKSIEAIFFEKTEENWKISGQTVIGSSSYQEEDEEEAEEGKAESEQEETE